MNYKELSDLTLLILGINQILFIWIAMNQYNIYKELKKMNEKTENE